MIKILVHRGTGTYFALNDDVWVVDDIAINNETGEIDDDILVATGKPVVDIIPDYDY